MPGINIYSNSAHCAANPSIIRVQVFIIYWLGVKESFRNFSKLERIVKRTTRLVAFLYSHSKGEVTVLMPSFGKQSAAPQCTMVMNNAARTMLPTATLGLRRMVKFRKLSRVRFLASNTVCGIQVRRCYKTDITIVIAHVKGVN